MDGFSVSINQETSEVEVVNGRMRLKVVLELYGKADGFDWKTNKRYRLTLKDGAIVATEITAH